MSAVLFIIIINHNHVNYAIKGISLMKEEDSGDVLLCLYTSINVLTIAVKRKIQFKKF